MPMQGSVDTLRAKPKFPKDRTQEGTVQAVVNAAAIFPNSTITVVSTANLVNGYIVRGWANDVYANANVYTINIGNNTPVVSGGSGVLGFNQQGPSIVNVQGTLITLSAPYTQNLSVGEVLWFSKPFNYKPNTYANTYNANTYLVSVNRLNNANSILHTANGSITTHTGWNCVKVGTGFVKSLSPLVNGAGWVVGAGMGYLPGPASGFVQFTANSQYGDTGAGANAVYNVNANGSITSFTVNSNGSNYILTPGSAILTNGTQIVANAVSLKYVSAVALTAGDWGSGYPNGAIVFTGGSGSGATGNVTVNTAGSIIAVTLFTNGGGWGTTSPTAAPPAGGTGGSLTVTMANGANAQIVTTMGGRANRILVETLSVVANARPTDSASGGVWFPGI